MRSKKINKTRSLVGYIEIRTPIGNDFENEYKILKKQGMSFYIFYTLYIAFAFD